MTNQEIASEHANNMFDNDNEVLPFTKESFKIHLETVLDDATSNLWTDEDMLTALHDGQKCSMRAYYTIDEKVWLESLKQSKRKSNTANANDQIPPEYCRV